MEGTGASDVDADRQGFWYGDDSPRDVARSVLEALRTYRAAEVAMRRRTSEAMSMKENELLALRFVMRHRDRPVRPSELTTYLGISSASTTSLIDRLEKHGHVERFANPGDRRSVFIRSTAESDDQVRETLGRMHDRMYASASRLSQEEARLVISFLHSMTEAVDEIASE